jgi:hypothetical protein
MRRVLLLCAVAVLGFGALASSASAASVLSTWTGLGSDANWTTPSNWDHTPGTTGSSLKFQNLGSCSSPDTCYSSNNDLTSATIDGITIDDGAPYGLTGNAFTLGSNGITANADTSSDFNMVSLATPITFGANQTWTIDGGNATQGIQLAGNLSGPTDTLGITFSNNGALSTSQDVNVGNVTLTGSDTTSKGDDADANGVMNLGGGSGNTITLGDVTLTDAMLGVENNATIGQLTSTGGNLQFGNGTSNTGILTAGGTVTLDPNSEATFTLGGGATAGTDYGQLNAGTHDVTLDGLLQLQLQRTDSGCATPIVGNVDTIVTTTGTLTGTFSDAADDTTLDTPAGLCPRTEVRINYTAHTVTLTVVDNAPRSTSPPTISGNLTVGQTLTANHGGWDSGGGSDPSSYDHQWKRCDSGGNNCANVGTDSSNYTLQGGDAGHTIRVVETATNAVGPSKPATSDRSGVVQAAVPVSAPTPPVDQTAPVVTGSTVVGSTMSTSAGTWTGSTPMSFAYQWQRCAATCSDIFGANGTSYTLTSGDLGMLIRAVVSASNGAGGPVRANSVQVGPVTASGAQIQSLLQSELVPHGKPDSITAILHAGGAVISQTALEGGVEQVSWYYLPPGAHIAGRHPRPVLIARGRVSFASEGTARLKLKLTRAGRRLLRRHRRHLKLTAKGTFTPTGGSGVSAKRNFKLKR